MAKIKLTILMPCLNEAETLSLCIKKAKLWISKNKVKSEILIADNGSNDGSQSIAKLHGARVISVKKKGYGNAIYFGCKKARGDYIIVGDSDNSYDFSKLDLFVNKLNQGYDLVMGNRFKGGISPYAMPWKNRYIGNPVLSWFGRLLFSCPIKDFHCGLRAFTKKSFIKMDLRTTGMEFASEMVIKACIFGLSIAEVPTTLEKDGRSRPPHLRPWRDGWRHLRFMLLFSPRWLFVFPGLFLFLISLPFYVFLLNGELIFNGIHLDIHTLFYAETGLILGFVAISFGMILRLFAFREGLMRENITLKYLKIYPIFETGSILGLLMTVSGFYSGLTSLFKWQALNFSALTNGLLLRTVSLSTLLIILGGIILLTSLVCGFLVLPTRGEREDL